MGSLKRSLGSIVLFGVLATVLVFAGFQTVQAESYVAGMVGVTIPHDISNVDIDDNTFCPAGGCTSSNLKLKESLMYGGKIGHYFDRGPLGIELEGFTTTPHLKEDSRTISGSCALCPVTVGGGSYFRVTTVALNLLARIPGEFLQPYAGVGVGAFFAKFHDVTGSQSSTAPGLNALLGLRFMLNPNLALFGEYKFNYARFDFDRTAGGDLGFKGTYMASHLVFGLGVHF